MWYNKRMRKTAIVLFGALIAFTCAAEPVCVDGVCYPDEESARAAGALGGSGGGGYGDLQNLLKGADPEKPEKPENPETQLSRRLAASGRFGL